MIEYGIQSEMDSSSRLFLSTMADILLYRDVLLLLLRDEDGYFTLQYTRKKNKMLSLSFLWDKSCLVGDLSGFILQCNIYL